MAIKTEIIAATSSISIAECEKSTTPSSQASPMTHCEREANEKALEPTHPEAVKILLPEIISISLDKTPEEEIPRNNEKKRGIEDTEVPHNSVTTNAGTIIAQGDFSAMIPVQSKALARLAILDALERRDDLKVRREQPEHDAANNSLVSHSTNHITEAAGQEIHNGPDRVLNGCIGIPNSPEHEQELVNDLFSDPLDQRHSNTGDERSGSRVADHVAIGPSQDIEIERTIDASSTDKEDEGGNRILMQGNSVANRNNEKLEKEDDISNNAANCKDSENIAHDDPAGLGDVLDIPKVENICVPTVYPPQDTTKIALTQSSSQIEDVDAALAPAEDFGGTGSATTPDDYAVREHSPAPHAEEEINGIHESPCLMPKQSKVKNNGNDAVAATFGPPKAAIPPKPAFASPTKLYEIKSVTNKGIGMFAKRFIPRGTRILHEPPLLLLDQSNGEEIYHVPLNFQKLPPHAQTAYLTLAATPNRTRDPIRLEWLQILSGTAMHAPLTLPMSTRQLVLQIFETNSFAADADSAIMPIASRINHCCTPNVYHNWNAALGPRGELTVHAIRDIAPREELLTSYINICTYQAERQEQLESYGFQCDCPACDTRTVTARDSEERRVRLFVVKRWLEERCSWLDGSEVGAAELEEGTLGAVVDVIALLRAEGLCNMELTRHYRLAYTISALLGDFVQACVWARKAVELTRICTGVDYVGYAEDVKSLRMLEERVRADEMMGGGG